ncbi:MAG: ABC transporter substrate-binding protein [Lachnospiraceae bacterium]|nr:ABC transporter substrate-binding protein [Lachnospiraceae bacterium]
MKKFKTFLMTLIMGALLMTGCGADKKDTQASVEPVTVRVMALKGPTAMGMVDFMDKSDSEEITDNDYQFEIVAAVDEVSPKLAQGQVDIAAVPANLASVLYNNTDGGVDVLAINTLGVIYIVESGDTISNISDLEGKTLYASGKGATPEYALNYILTQNGIDPETDLTIEWKSEHAECLAALMADENAIAMLPQPFVTTAQTQSEQIRVALDLTEEWDKLGTDSALLTGVVVARKEFIEANPAAVEAFMEHYEASVKYVNENVEDAATLIEKYDIVPAAVAVKAVPNCNIVFIKGNEMKQKLSGYLGVLLEQNPKSVGGALPADDFYYGN